MAKTVRVGDFQSMQRQAARPNHVGLSEIDLERPVGSKRDVASVDPMTGQFRDTADTSPGFRTPPLTVAEQLAVLVLQDDIAGMPLGQVVGLVRLAVASGHVNATETEIRDEAERRHAASAQLVAAEEAPVEPTHDEQVAEILAEKHARGLHAGFVIGGCPGCDERIELRPEDRAELIDPLTGMPEDTAAFRLQQLGVELLATAEWSLSMIVSRIGPAAIDIDPYPSEDEIAAEADRIWRSFAENRSGPREATVNSDGTVRDWRRPDTTPDRGEDVGTTHHTVTDDDQRFSGAGAEWSEGERPISAMIPQDIAFQKRQFMAAPALANLADKLIEEHGFLEQLEHCEIDFKWQRIGANSQGKRTIGGMKRVSGVWTDYAEAQFIISLSADTARLAQFTDRQVEAALFHQLLHIGKDKKGNWIKVGHDFEGFGTEVRHYGPWTEDLKIGSQAFTVAVQLGLDLDADDDDDEGEGEAAGQAYFDAAGEAMERDIAAGAGVLIHDDGTPLTDDEIEAQERHELDDDPASGYEDLDEDDDDVEAFDPEEDGEPTDEDDDPLADHDL